MDKEAADLPDDIDTLTAVAEDAGAAGQGTTPVSGFSRRKPVRGPLPAHLPRERVVLPGPSACPCCGGKLHKIGEDVTETLEVAPRRYKVVQTVREKFSCRACEAITQPPAPFHPIARGRAGASLLAMILYAKFGNHLPLNRQSDDFAREGIELDVSTLADWVGAAVTALSPLTRLIEAHVFAAERLHGDDTTVPVLAKMKTATGRIWTYVRDDRPFGGSAPPAAVFYYSRSREGVHPTRHLAGYAGILQADAYAGYTDLYEPNRRPGPITEAACWAHSRRKFFILADVAKRAASAKPLAPLAIEAVRRIEAIFAIEREIAGQTAAERLARRRQDVAPLVIELEAWMRTERARLSRHNDVAERALRGIALGRKAWLFAGSDRGGDRAAAVYTLIATAKLNDVDPQAWLADVLRRIASHPASRIADLLPWNWKIAQTAAAA